MTTAIQKPLPVKILALRIDDDLEDWSIDEKHKPHIKAIYSIFLVDINMKTHICSFTPSYWLEFVDRGIEYVDYDMDEDLREEIDQTYRYTQLDEESGYYDCSDIARMVKAARKKKWYLDRLGVFPVDDETIGDNDQEKRENIVRAEAEEYRCDNPLL